MDKISVKFINIDSDIRQLLIKVREIVGYQLYLGDGKAWRIDKNTLENSKSVNKLNLEKAVEVWFKHCDKKLDFVVWRMDLKSECLIEIADNIINANIKGIRKELHAYIQCVDVVMPESIIEVNTKNICKRYIEL